MSGGCGIGYAAVIIVVTGVSIILLIGLGGALHGCRRYYHDELNEHEKKKVREILNKVTGGFIDV